MEDYKKTIAANIRAFRIAAGLNQRDLAARIGVTSGSISHWEKGQNSIDIDTLYKVARELNVSLDAICGVDENKIVLSPREEELVKAFRNCTFERQNIILELLGLKRDSDTSSGSNEILSS